MCVRTHIRFLDVLSGIPPKTCASIAPNTGMRKRRGRQRDTATGIGDSVSLETDESTLGYKRVFGLVIDFGTSQSPKSTRPLTTYLALPLIEWAPII